MFRFIDPNDMVPVELFALEEWPDGLLQGTPVSHGSGAGVALTAMRVTDAAHFRPGDVLVVSHPTPDWAALISEAAAVIAESGGALSNLAVTAREHGIPAVFGLRGATQIIPSGADVEVNGTTGTVRWR